MPSANMGLTYPTNHGSSGVWDVILATLFDAVDAHDHTTGKGVRIPSGGIQVDDDIAMALGGTSFAFTDVLALAFRPVATSLVAGYSSALFANSADNNLYFRNSGGTNVKITDGATLNISLAGGIGGDYASVGALFSFDDATDSYWAQQQGSPRPWARLRVGDVDIYETAASIANRVRLKSPSALATSYDLTLPTGLPATTRGLSVSSTGVVTAADKHGTRTISIPASSFVPEAGSAATYSYSPGSDAAYSQNAPNARASVSIPVGSRVTAIRVYAKDSVTGPTKVQAVFQTEVPGTGKSNIASSSASSGGGTAQTLSITSLTSVVTTGEFLSIQVITTTGASGCLIYGAEVDYDNL